MPNLSARMPVDRAELVAVIRALLPLAQLAFDATTTGGEGSQRLEVIQRAQRAILPEDDLLALVHPRCRCGHAHSAACPLCGCGSWRDPEAAEARADDASVDPPHVDDVPALVRA